MFAIENCIPKRRISMEYEDYLVGAENALRDGTIFDFICSEAHNLSRGDLTTLAKELAYGISKVNIINDNPQVIYDIVADELESQRT